MVVVNGGDGKEVTSVSVCVWRGDYGVTGWPWGWVGKITGLDEEGDGVCDSWCAVQWGEGETDREEMVLISKARSVLLSHFASTVDSAETGPTVGIPEGKRSKTIKESCNCLVYFPEKFI